MGADFQNGIKPTIDNYNSYKDQGEFTLWVFPLKLEDANGIPLETVFGGHAMSVTGVTPDGRFIVSSWGEKYYVNPDAYNTFYPTYFKMQVITFD
jgi:hypothetical protein